MSNIIPSRRPRFTITFNTAAMDVLFPDVDVTCPSALRKAPFETFFGTMLFHRDGWKGENPLSLDGTPRLQEGGVDVTAVASEQLLTRHMFSGKQLAATLQDLFHEKHSARTDWCNRGAKICVVPNFDY